MDNKGFTIFEVTLVLVMIGLLVVVFTPSMGVYREVASLRGASDSIDEIRYLSEMYEIKNDTYPLGEEIESSVILDYISERKIANNEGVVIELNVEGIVFNEIDTTLFNKRNELGDYYFIKDSDGDYYIVSEKPFEE